VFTHDLDYGKLLAFSGDAFPSVILLRLPRANAELIFRRIIAEWREIEESLTSGAIVVMEESATRIRHLPIASSR
jgi:predicted nuclease of predicted toxin-antitoxin system